MYPGIGCCVIFSRPSVGGLFFFVVTAHGEHFVFLWRIGSIVYLLTQIVAEYINATSARATPHFC